jgi:hypothetical protein
MRNTIYTIVFAALGFCFINTSAQDVSAKLKEAETAYSSNNLDNARFALQEALNEINQEIGKEILGLLPTKMNILAYNEKEDNVTGASGFAGLFVNRTFGKGDTSAKIDIISDSPLIASLNAMLSMPMFMGASNGNDKKIKVNGYKGLLQKSTNENKTVSYTIQIPLNQTLLTLHVSGNFGENDATNMANSLPIEKIAKLAQ